MKLSATDVPESSDILTVAKLEQILREIDADCMEKRQLIQYAIPHINTLVALGYKISAIHKAFCNANVNISRGTFATEVSRARMRLKEQDKEAAANDGNRYDLLWLHSIMVQKKVNSASSTGNRGHQAANGPGERTTRKEASPIDRYEALKRKMSNGGVPDNSGNY